MFCFGATYKCKKAERSWEDLNSTKRKPLDITFHNPNTPEQTVNYMVKVFAQELYRQTMDKPSSLLAEQAEKMAR